GGRRADLRGARARGHQHPDDLDLGDQGVRGDRRQVHRARGARAARCARRQGRGGTLMRRIQIYDTTLRDGCQGEEIALTVDAKLAVAEKLDAFGVHYIEGGWPGSNPRDAAFFGPAMKLGLKHAKIVAFGSTRRPNVPAHEDQNLAMILKAGTPVACIVGKTWDLHVREELRISREANLELLH